MIIVMTRRLARTPKNGNASPQATESFKQALRSSPSGYANMHIRS
jgi:hypothetical protein